MHAEARPAPEASSPTPTPVAVIVAARNEADRIGATLDALATTFPGAEIWVGDDASDDGTGDVVLRHGAKLIRRGRSHGKGANVTAAAEALLSERPAKGVVLLCDGDLGESAAALAPLVGAVGSGGCEVAIAAFARRVGGGFGLAVGFSRWASERLGGVSLSAPISGQRAIRADALPSLLPFADGYGMETAMNIDAARAGLRIDEVELELSHRATGRTLGGFLHRARQLYDFVRVYLSRR